MKKLNSSFTRSIERSVEDCSNPFQLRQCMKRYTTYLYIEQITQIFEDRLIILEGLNSHDSLIREAISNLREDLEVEEQIAKVCSNNVTSSDPMDPRHKVQQLQNFEESIEDIVIDVDNTKHHIEAEKVALKRLFDAMNGNKLFICRFLDCDSKKLNNKIIQYNLKGYLNKIRRDFRSNLRNKLRANQ